MLGYLYRPFVDAVNDNTEEVGDGNLMALLLGSSYTFDAEHEFVSDLVPATNEIVAVDYTRAVVADPTINRTGNLLSVSVGNLVWAAFTSTGVDAPAYAVVYREVVDDTDSPVLFCQDFEGTQDVDSEQLQISEPSGGFIQQIVDPASVTP